MESCYEKSGTLDGDAKKYWKAIRDRSKIGDYNITIDNTNMITESQTDWGAYSAGNLVDPTLFNIRRERRCELMAEGFRSADIRRWRSMDQMINTPYHILGMNLWEEMTNNADFLKKPSRQSLKEYLQNNVDEMTPSQIDAISKLVTTLETGAVDDYVNQMNYQKQLENANKEAISKMNTNVTNTSNVSNNALNKIFTREDVKNMTTDEFLANEEQIMAQLREEMKNRKK